MFKSSRSVRHAAISGFLFLAIAFLGFPHLVRGADDMAATSREYDVTDLVTGLFAAPEPDSVNLSVVAPATRPAAANAQNADDVAREIARKIQGTIAYNTWQTPKVSLAVQATDHSAKLVISQTPEVQGQIAALLHQLRESRSLRVAVKFQLISIAPESAEAAAILRKKTDDKTAVYVSADDANALIKSLKELKVAEVREVNLKPFPSGGGAHAIRETLYPYIAGYVVGKDDKKNPVLANASSGELIDVVRAVVTADHKYVTMDLRFQQSRFEGFVEKGDAENPVQEPIEHLTELPLRLTIPDKGCLLLVIPAPKLMDKNAPGDDAKKAPEEPSVFLLITPEISVVAVAAMGR